MIYNHEFVKYVIELKNAKVCCNYGWVIGTIPEGSVNNYIEDIFASVGSRGRIFANIYSYTIGTYKSIKGMLLNYLILC